MTKAEARKDDGEKTQLELLSPSWLVGVGKVLTFGARKYSAHNWRLGLQRSRLLGAALRHILAYLGGEDDDSETGLLHLFHASCCLMFASELHFTRPDLDDRWKDKPRCENHGADVKCVLCSEELRSEPAQEEMRSKIREILNG